QGRYQGPTPIPFTPGGEVAGRVRAVGEGVTTFAPGHRVVTIAGKGLSECVVAPAAAAFPLDDRIASASAAALLVNYGTAWFALHDRAHLQRGETLLVTGAAGGTGTAAIQLGLAAGARVIAVVGGAAKAELCRGLGAHVVIDHHATPAWVDDVRAATDGAGADVAFDPVGGDAFHKARRCMAWDGRLLVIGFVAGIADAPTNHILLKNYAVVGVHWGASLQRDPASLGRQARAVLDLVAAGAVDPPLYPAYGFADAARALQDLAERATWGKSVVTAPAESVA
ncbi:MAG TPA: NADPH:quinone oxidoreductase family protein, partial [Acidimicrobiales bacterium]|nr:NADPH:quinone oxidoreductase family protein [Acidimicrobiales bacterium]